MSHAAKDRLFVLPLALLLAACEHSTALKGPRDVAGVTVAATASLVGPSLIVLPAVAQVIIGDSLQLALGVTPTTPPAWTSSNVAAATVGFTTGLVHGVAAGASWIRVQTSFGDDSVAITARARRVVRVGPQAVALGIGTTAQLASNTAGSWASDDSTMAQVSPTGLVTGRRAGSTGATLHTAIDGTAWLAITVQSSVVATVTVTPSVLALVPGARQTLSHVARDAAGGLIQGRQVSWSSSDPRVATVGDNGAVLAVAPGTATISATVSGVAGTMTLTVAPLGVAGSVADPTALPVAAGQLKDVAAYTALDVPNLAAGSSYVDPVSGVRIWKVSSPNVPLAANTSVAHEYSEGPAPISREYAGRHTLVIQAMNGARTFVDFVRGSGLTNYRPAPPGTLAVTFARDPATPTIAYLVMRGGQLRRYDVASNAFADVAPFPVAFSGVGWLQNDMTDRRFVAIVAGRNNDVTAWDRATGQTSTRTFAHLDEPYLEKNGRYVMANTSLKAVSIWDLDNDTVNPMAAPGNAMFAHVGAVRGLFVTADVNTGVGKTPLWAVDPSSARAHWSFNTLGGYYPDAHLSGQWVESDAELGGDLRRQWVLRETYDWSYVAVGTSGVKEGFAFLTLDGSQCRFVAHHYSVKPPPSLGTVFSYYSTPRASTSIDGKLIVFDSNMNGTARTDVFLIEVPVR
ncbi:MAG: Ig-like domain-containing protein [Gemmatimonadetes bacterium]|nr:Ig-like domain-containing protein [Gemmatimonadota bacterium]